MLNILPKNHLRLLLILITQAISIIGFAQNRATNISEIPQAIIQEASAKYNSNSATQAETTFDAYLANYYFQIMEEQDRKSRYGGVRTTNNMCVSGDFETGSLDATVWDAFWTGGSEGLISDPNLPIATWNFGALPLGGSPDPGIGVNCSSHPLQSHHVVVDKTVTPNDPIVPFLSVVPPTPLVNNHSLRIGNTCPSHGGERVEKSFVVVPGQTTLSFWYQVVMQNPQSPYHPPSEQPGFGAYLYDGGGSDISSLISLDATAPSSNFLVADNTNPFFGVHAGGSIVYKEWTCVEVDLAAYVNQTVTLVFAVRDCLKGGHYGYAYIDNLCLSCSGNPTGWVDFDKSTSDSCGTGQLCFNYTVPFKEQTTGTVDLKLELFQDGLPAGVTLTSPSLTSNGTYCFDLDMTGLNVALDGFDWVATANFTFPGAVIAPELIGSPPSGVEIGLNNDYLFNCSVPDSSCCCCDSAFYQTSLDKTWLVSNTIGNNWNTDPEYDTSLWKTPFVATLPGSYPGLNGGIHIDGINTVSDCYTAAELAEIWSTAPTFPVWYPAPTSTLDFYTRKNIEIADVEKVLSAKVFVAVDNEYEIYVNGTLLTPFGAPPTLEMVEIAVDNALLVNGENVIAAKFTDTNGKCRWAKLRFEMMYLDCFKGNNWKESTTGSVILQDDRDSVGIGTSKPIEKLHVDGNVYVTGSLTALKGYTPSDSRFKNNIKPMNDALDLIKKMNPMSYFYKSEFFNEKEETSQPSYGFLAQDMLEIIPSLVGKDKNGYLKMDYVSLIPFLTKAIQEQQKRIELLEELLKNKDK
ncbi:tail fiber domain-containing protein [Lacihabitans sp. LS3-19]|uniref:tail fiber domain-containing protein n=1 Tax=Lacihabitans sp. LS3-19 TaxID=2487335 RepID=UPI0020CEADC1|nr:tail fiber domain-containing protein [Lacihabitans sp. LS3-19]